MLLCRGNPRGCPPCRGKKPFARFCRGNRERVWTATRCKPLVVALFLLRVLIGEDDEVGKVDVSISVEVKVSLIAGVAPVQAKVLDE